MFKSFLLAVATLAMAPAISSADVRVFSPQDVTVIEDALDALVTPARVDSVEVGVGIGDGDDDFHFGRRQYICYARDGWGRTYDSRGFDSSRVQRRAVMECARSSRFRCQPAGCRVLR